MPPPTQGLFRTLMEELQTQAAIQRDQFMANSSRHDPSGETPDFSFHGHHHHSRSLPRFMMEPLDFLTLDYESCLEPGPDSNTGAESAPAGASFQDSLVPMNVVHTSSSTDTPSIPARSGPVVSQAQITSTFIPGSPSASNPKKRPISDDSHMYTEGGDLATPPTISSNHEHFAPPQDMFRLLMEELEAQAAIQRDPGHYQDHSQHHSHSRLPRFALDPFDVLSDGYGTMQMDHSNTPSSEAKQDVFMGQIGSSHQPAAQTSTDSVTTAHPAAPSSLSAHEEHLPPQDLFRTLMEELETQAAFQRDQVLAATTGTAPRVDPEEYVFNGQHLRPLPRFMFEPLDFLSVGYESCLHGELNHGSGSDSQHFGSPHHHSFNVGVTAPSPSHPSPPGNQTTRPGSPGNRLKKTAKAGKYKTILPHRQEPHASGGPLSNPLKKRRIGDEVEADSSGLSLSPPMLSLSTNSASLPGIGGGANDHLESPITPTELSASFMTSNIDQTLLDDSGASSPEGSTEGASLAAKRPWTPEEEKLLLELFTKRTPIKEIARTLDRTVHSVRSRRQILTDPGFVKGKGHGVSRRCKADSATTTKLPTYAQMAFLSLAWLPDLEGTLNDVASMVEKLFSRHLNRIPRTGHKNLQIWRAQISDALAHEKGQPRPRFESFGLKRGRQWVYRLTEFGKGIVQAMGGVDTICQDLLKSNEMEMEMAASLGTDDGAGGDPTQSIGRDADGVLGGRSESGADAGIGQGQGYGYSYRPPEARQKSGKRSRASRRAKKKLAEMGQGDGTPVDGAASAIANAMEAMAAGLAKMMALEDERAAAAAS
ncbi:hypothetical protein BGX31_007994 [Mortierella sp. GBA43]|nr:hypothetical protein BGX31_007994 [Mortierella sp. GBA43]